MMKDILQKVNKKTLIVSDVDGTILDNNGELDVETRNIINKYIKYGSFTIATGRSYTMACKILNGIKFDLPIITNDGACIYTPQGKMLKCFTIEQNKLLNKALDILYKTHTILSYSQYEGSEKVFWLGDLNKLTKIYLCNSKNKPPAMQGEDRSLDISMNSCAKIKVGLQNHK